MIKLNEKQIRVNLIQNDIKNDFAIKVKTNYVKNDLKYNLISKINKAFIRFIIFILLISLCISKQIRKLSSPSSITITVSGEGGYVRLLSTSSEIKIPDRILIKGEKVDIPSNFMPNKIINIENIENQNEVEITMEFFLEEKISFKNLFCNTMTHLKKADFSKFDISKVTEMNSMFEHCLSLKEIIFGEFDTSNVKTMEHMFFGCTFTSFKLPKLKTNSLTNVKGMFSNCGSLTSIDLSNFDTTSVVNYDSMFLNDYSLSYANLYSFSENSVKNIDVGNIFKDAKYDLIICINEEKVPKIKKEMEKKNGMKNDCNAFGNIYTDKNEDKDDNHVLETNIANNYKITETIINEITNIEEKTEEKTEKQTEEKTEVKTEEKTEKQTEEKTEAKTEEKTEEKTEKQTEEKTEAKTEEKSQEKTEDKKSNELMKNCTAVDFFKGNCGTQSDSLSTENKDDMINNIIDNIISGNLNTLLSNVTENNKDFLIKEDDIIFQITTTDNQNNNDYNNISNIKLGECEDELKRIYNISKNKSLIILKIDYFMPGLLIPVIGYEVFHPENRTKLDLSYCQEFLINYNIPVSIDENNVDKYDPNSDYYNDECSAYTSDDGTDITLNDRKVEYNENNLSLCENNCTFTEYDSDTKKSICMCEIKTKIYSISEIIENKDSVSNSFNTEEKSNSTSNVGVMKCYNTLFSKYGLLKNMGNYILLFFVVIFAISGILFYKVGYVMLCNDIQEILNSKGINIIGDDGVNIYGKSKKKKGKKKKRKNLKKKHKKKENIFDIENPPKRKLNSNKIRIDSNITSKEFSNQKTSSKINLKYNKITSLNEKKPKKLKLRSKKKSKKSTILQKSLIEKLAFNIYELNTFPYNKALLYDKRTYYEYYISLLKTKHPLIFSFIPIKDFNTMIIKIDMFIISFSIYYTMNTLFFTESTIHKIYEDKGEYNFGYHFPKSLLSFFISYFIIIPIKLIFLSERNISAIKNEEDKEVVVDMDEKVRRCLIIKYIIFYILGFLFLILFWYYLSSFCAVYQNSQIFLFLNTFVSFCISLIYPFFINIFPGFFRIYSLKNQNKSCVYNFSKVLQVL